MEDKTSTHQELERAISTLEKEIKAPVASLSLQ